MLPAAAGADEKPLVLLSQPPFPAFTAALEGKFRLVLAADADAATAAEARVLLVAGLKAVTAELIDRFPALELVAAGSVGLDHVDLDACRRRGVAVTNAGAAFSVDSADYAVGLVVAVLRRVAAAEAHLRRGRWAMDGDFPLTTKVGDFIMCISSSAAFGPESQLCCPLRGAKVAHFISHWMRNGGHMAR